VEFGPKKDVSAGPFVLQRVNPGEAVLVKNTHFFDADKIAPSKVVLKNYSGNEQIWNYLIAGELDAAIYTATPANVRKKILAKQGNKMISGFSPVAAALAFNQSVKPLDNVHVRRALAYLIDRKLTTKIGESIGGAPSQTTTGLISDAANAWIGQAAVDKLNQYPHDAGKAEAELKKAGMSKKGGQWIQANGKPFTLQLQVPNGFSDWIAGGKSISSQLTDAGIKTEVKTSADYATYLSEIAEGKYQLGFWLIALGPSTHDAYARLYGPSNGWNQFGANVQHSAPGKNGNWMGGAEKATIPGLGTINPGELTNKLAQANEAQQKEIVAKLAAYSNDQLPAIQIWDYTNIQFVNESRFTNFPKNDSDVLRLHPGMWMQLGYIQKKK
jgi:peptide/nickel transport system substrate-binding protein